MIGWTEQQQMIRTMIRDFVEKEIVPHIDDLEYGGMPPYDILRKLFRTFGMDELSAARFDKQIAREETGDAKAEGPGADDAGAGEVTPRNWMRSPWACCPLSRSAATARAW